MIELAKRWVMMTEIAIVSGRILELLEEEEGSLSISEIRFRLLDESAELIFMSIGWLVRDQYVHITRNDNENYLVLIPKEELSLKMLEPAVAE